MKTITTEFITDFFNIDLKEAKQVHKSLERITYANDEVIVAFGDEADGIYFIDEGQATVINESGEAINELEAGHYFGEYAVLADEPRSSTVKAHGKVTVYRMSPEDFRIIAVRNPKIAGRLLKQIYGQITDKHKRLESLTNRYRGVMWSPTGTDDSRISSIILTYGITIIVFAAVFIAARNINSNNVWWQLLPVAFLMAFTLRTKRVVEGMLLCVLLISGMLYKGNFLLGFGEMMTEGIGNPDTGRTIVIMAMVEVVAALLASSGVVSAFKKLAEKHVKTKSGSLFGMLFIMIVVCIDECLNVITAGFCMNDIADRFKIPREVRALLGSFSLAICSLIPFSLWSSYITGWVSMYYKKGGNIFLSSIPFNLAGVCAFIFAILLCTGVLPRTDQIKKACKRVSEGGEPWPEGSKLYLDIDAANGVVGRPINLILPMAVWSVASIVCGMLENPGAFALSPVPALLITIVFMFFLYVGQRLLTPKAFFEITAGGIGNSLMPILLLVFAERIAAGLDELGFDEVLEIAIPRMVGGNKALIPMLLFILFTLIGIVLSSCWGTYGLGIPVSVYLSQRLGLNVSFCLGAVLAAGIIGEALCPYLNETLPAVTSIGCAPVHYRKLCIQYWIPIAVICILGYMVMGFMMV